MLKRHWGILLTLVVALSVSAGLWFNLKPREPNLPRHEYGRGPAEGYQAGGGNCQPSVLAAIRNRRQAARERERCAEEAEDHRLQSDDLVQQTRAANAAEAQAELSYQMAWMGVYGTIGGFLTLIAASMAAFYAREAARESKRSADFTGQMAFDNTVAITAAVEANNEMRESNRIMSENGRRQLRAYVTVTNVSILEVPGENAKIGASVTMRNDGETPAKNMTAKLSIAIHSGDITECNLTEHAVPGGQSKLILGKGDVRKISHQTQIQQGKNTHEIWTGDYSCFAYGVITYHDVFDEEHETRFCCFRSPTTRDLDPSICAATTGNSMT